VKKETEQNPADSAVGVPIQTGEKPVPVEVAYAMPARQVILKISLLPGTSAAEAIELSGIRKLFPGIEKLPNVGVFSRKVSLEYLMQPGDRLEIYRPLLVDPKEVRRRKAEEQKAQTKSVAREEIDKLRRH
jgi:putative ubiquitin-RnfH superfamily antitoxin RatB of RatAB toxin-antitoxin module